MEQKTIEDLSVDELKNALINAQEHILRVPQVQQEIEVIKQELAKRLKTTGEVKEEPKQ